MVFFSLLLLLGFFGYEISLPTDELDICRAIDGSRIFWQKDEKLCSSTVSSLPHLEREREA